MMKFMVSARFYRLSVNSEMMSTENCLMVYAQPAQKKIMRLRYSGRLDMTSVVYSGHKSK